MAEINGVKLGNGKKRKEAKFEPYGYETLNYAGTIGIVNKYDYNDFYTEVGVDTQNSTLGLVILFAKLHKVEFADFAKKLQSGEIPLSECRTSTHRDAELGPNGTKAQVTAPVVAPEAAPEVPAA